MREGVGMSNDAGGGRVSREGERRDKQGERGEEQAEREGGWTSREWSEQAEREGGKMSREEGGRMTMEEGGKDDQGGRGERWTGRKGGKDEQGGRGKGQAGREGGRTSREGVVGLVSHSMGVMWWWGKCGLALGSVLRLWMTVVGVWWLLVGRVMFVAAARKNKIKRGKELKKENISYLILSYIRELNPSFHLHLHLGYKSCSDRALWVACYPFHHNPLCCSHHMGFCSIS